MLASHLRTVQSGRSKCAPTTLISTIGSTMAGQGDPSPSAVAAVFLVDRFDRLIGFGGACVRVHGDQTKETSKGV